MNRLELEILIQECRGLALLLFCEGVAYMPYWLDEEEAQGKLCRW